MPSAILELIAVLSFVPLMHDRYRLYRDACMALEGNYLKDLNVLGRDLSKVAIVDNSPYAYGFQVIFYPSKGDELVFFSDPIAPTFCFGPLQI